MDTHIHFVAPDLTNLLADLGDRLGQLRHRRGLTQRDAAAAVGIAGPYISLIESAKREASISTIANLVALYGGQLILEVRTSDAPRKLEDGKSSADLVWLKRAADNRPNPRMIYDALGNHRGRRRFWRSVRVQPDHPTPARPCCFHPFAPCSGTLLNAGRRCKPKNVRPPNGSRAHRIRGSAC